MPACSLMAVRIPSRPFDALSVRYYLSGSVASSAHGVPRASLDADIVASLDAAHVDPLIARLEAAYYIPVERLTQAVAMHSSCNFIHLATMFKIDLFVAK